MSAPMDFDPLKGGRVPPNYSRVAADWRPEAGTPTDIAASLVWRFDPWAGTSRDARDIASDPFGLLIVAPNGRLQAAVTERKSCDRVDTMHNSMVDGIAKRNAESQPDRRNPKDAAGRAKVPLALLSPIAKAAWAMAQFVGKVKYGAWNWRGTEVLANVYVSAAQRHLDAWFSGETYDPDDGTHHLGNVMACAAILLDAAACGKLIDDRPPRVSHRLAYAEAEAIVAPTEAKYADREVKHWTIADSVAPATLPTPSNQQGENDVAALSDALAARARSRQENRETGREET